MVIPAESLQSFQALAFGFAVAAVLATGYQALTRRPPSFRLLQRGPTAWRYAAVPFLAFAAPFIIMRLTLRAPRDRRQFYTVMTATVIAGIWSLMSGTVVVMALEALRP
jgi:lipopolysaccharide export LptBFGC system permease protein LptF